MSRGMGALTRPPFLCKMRSWVGGIAAPSKFTVKKARDEGVPYYGLIFERSEEVTKVVRIDHDEFCWIKLDDGQWWLDAELISDTKLIRTIKSEYDTQIAFGTPVAKVQYRPVRRFLSRHASRIHKLLFYSTSTSWILMGFVIDEPSLAGLVYIVVTVAATALFLCSASRNRLWRRFFDIPVMRK